MPTGPVLDADNAAFVTSGVSIAVASRNAQRIPSLTRAWGCRVSGDRRTVTLYVSPQQGEALLADLQAGGPLAAVFSLPSTHRTIQLKARSARVGALADEDRLVIERYAPALAANLERVGHGGGFAAAYLEIAGNALASVAFEPEEAFAQTPGPKAGARLERPA
ncbi:MAG: hypothetical protein H6R27_2105 [Proteobacteria bacterium]|nr:hypothetical protein [Pseudomonadota bacterium]